MPQGVQSHRGAPSVSPDRPIVKPRVFLRRAPPNTSHVTGRAGLPAVSHRPGTRVHRLENPKVPVQLVLSRVVADGPAGADRDRTRADAVHDASGAPQELHQIIDQLGIVEVNRCHCRSLRPRAAAAGPHISLWPRSKAGQLAVRTGCQDPRPQVHSPARGARRPAAARAVSVRLGSRVKRQPRPRKPPET
jgi:hypothetical protein